MLKKAKLAAQPARMGAIHAHQAKTASLASVFAVGLARHQAGRLAEAERIYRQILAVLPDHFDSRQLLGAIFLQRGQHAEALQHIERALKSSPDNVFVLNNQGVVLQELKRYEEALKNLERALVLRPDYADAHSNRGNVLKALLRFNEALASYDRALALRPDFAQAHSNRGDVLCELKRFEEALASCERALKLQPNFAEAHCNRANALRKLKRLDEALAGYDRALSLKPNYADAHSNRGTVLHDLHCFEEALVSYDRALALRPDFAEALSNRGNALQELHRFEEALEEYQRACRLRQDFAEAYSNCGNALRELDRFEEALASFERAIALRPEFAEAHFNAAHCLLLTGEFGRGWKQYEWRWLTDQLNSEERSFAQPQWTGSNEIAGKTILLHAEQGLGDTLQFCRYVPRVTARGARVILEVQKPLVALMPTLASGTEIIAKGDALPAFDLHCPLLSLPLAFNTELDTIPGEIRYLSSDPAKRDGWRARLGPHNKSRVGLVWAGDPRKRLPNAHLIDRQRSVTFDILAPLFDVAECEFVSLQKGEDAVAQLRNSPLRHRVIDWSGDFHDFSDTAALIDNLDLVIAVDTSVAHLAGALGKPMWLLNRYNTCWRWLLDRDDSPWYPSVRQFRQDKTRKWDPVIARVAAALRDYVQRAA
ncbi:MAG: tetratricopeptide repeat protein [Xanthobacteraceae bacterium]